MTLDSSEAAAVRMMPSRRRAPDKRNPPTNKLSASAGPVCHCFSREQIHFPRVCIVHPRAWDARGIGTSNINRRVGSHKVVGATDFYAPATITVWCAGNDLENILLKLDQHQSRYKRRMSMMDENPVTGVAKLAATGGRYENDH